MQLAEVDLECARWHWEQSNPLAPEDLGDEYFFTHPANIAILADLAHDVAIVVCDVINRIWESSQACSINRSRSLHEEGLVRTLFIETVLER